MNQYWLYIMTNKNNTTLYTGATNNLQRRVWEHKNGTGSKFTSKYKITKLVFYESFTRIYDAIAAEKQVKAGSRAKKTSLIESINPEWRDLYENPLK
jgi:putative endonuclease